MNKVYAVFKYWWEGDGGLVKELQEPLFIEIDDAYRHGIDIHENEKRNWSKYYESQKQRLEEIKNSGGYTTERLSKEIYPTLLVLDSLEPNEEDGYYGHPSIFRIEELEVK